MSEQSTGYGVVYTPNNLADYVAELLISEYRKDCHGGSIPITILDPACGEGALLRAVERTCHGRRPFQSARFIGIDIDADIIAQNKREFDASKYSFYSQDAILPDASKISSEYWKASGVNPELIIANPPWSSEKLYKNDTLTKAGFQFDFGQYDSYVLFLDLSLALLRNNGYAAFIIPDSIFYSENKSLRRFLAEETQIRVIARLGEKIFPSVFRAATVILIKKAKPEEDSKTVCFRLSTDQRKDVLEGKKTLIECHYENAHIIRQRRFSLSPNCLFDIDTQASEEALLNKLEQDSIIWTDIFHFSRGVEISKSGSIVYCPNCGMAQVFIRKNSKTAGIKKCASCSATFNLDDAVSQRIIDRDYHSGYHRLFAGENIRRYGFNGSLFIRPDVRGINYKDRRTYETEHILIRKTGLGINACIDRSGSYFTQTVYSCSFTSRENPIPLEYYLGVLNSRVLYYYYLKKYGENEWKSHPYITKEILFSLPIPKITDRNLNLCQRIAETAGSLQRDYSWETDLALEGLIVRLYGLSRQEWDTILSVINRLPDLSAINSMKVYEEIPCLDI